MATVPPPSPVTHAFHPPSLEWEYLGQDPVAQRTKGEHIAAGVKNAVSHRLGCRKPPGLAGVERWNQGCLRMTRTNRQSNEDGGRGEAKVYGKHPFPIRGHAKRKEEEEEEEQQQRTCAVP